MNSYHMTLIMSFYYYISLLALTKFTCFVLLVDDSFELNPNPVLSWKDFWLFNNFSRILVLSLNLSNFFPFSKWFMKAFEYLFLEMVFRFVLPKCLDSFSSFEDSKINVSKQTCLLLLLTLLVASMGWQLLTRSLS